jgi:hypothetical protein
LRLSPPPVVIAGIAQVPATRYHNCSNGVEGAIPASARSRHLPTRPDFQHTGRDLWMKIKKMTNSSRKFVRSAQRSLKNAATISTDSLNGTCGCKRRIQKAWSITFQRLAQSRSRRNQNSDPTATLKPGKTSSPSSRSEELRMTIWFRPRYTVTVVVSGSTTQTIRQPAASQS